MPRAPREEVQLSESWDDINDSRHEDQRPIFEEDDERREMGDYYRPSRPSINGRTDRDSPPRRTPRSSREPELIMPRSPDAGERRSSNTRATTPHFRSINRSMTSDAGEIRKQTRATTPHSRLNQRSLTSDAGQFKASSLKRMDGINEEGDDDGLGGDIGSAAWNRVVLPVLEYSLDILGRAMRTAKPILGYVVLAYLLGAAVVFFSGFLTNSINNALSPFCRLPLTSSLPFCAPIAAPELKGPAEFDRLVQAQDAFQDVLASTSVGVNLPLDMKRSEASIRDLKHVVEYSHLPSRHELVFEFSGFIELARKVSLDLGRFNSRIGRAVDRILSTNRWTLSVIEGVRTSESSKGSISRWMNGNLNIFGPFQPISLSEDVLLDQYLRHTSAVEEQILNLITEAQALRSLLDDLDGRLDVIAGIATRDGIKAEANKDELFAMLWTKLGGNRGSVAKVNQQLELLKNVGTYRRIAWGHVTSTLVKLQGIQHSLEDLRERVAVPEVSGVDKVPLEIHIESINLGIERLEQQRDATRKAESDTYAKVAAKGADAEKRMIGGGEL